MKEIKSRIILKHDIEENWNKASSFIPKQGEIIIYDIDNDHTCERMKIGDGVTNVVALSFYKSDINQDDIEKVLEDAKYYIDEKVSSAIEDQIITTFDTDLVGSHAGGLKINNIYGRSEQDSTPGYQLFDASKLATKSAGGATVTNNGDGSLTISGSGSLTAPIGDVYNYTHEETVAMVRTGTINFNVEDSYPLVIVYLIVGSNTISLNHNINTAEITQEMLDNPDFFIRLNIYGAQGNAIVPATVKPMLYQDGDGTWEPFTGGMASPNPQYRQDIVSVGDSGSVGAKVVGKNLLDATLWANGAWTTNGAGTSTYNARSINDIKVKPNTKYLFSANTTVNNIRLHEYKADGEYIKTTENVKSDNVSIITDTETDFIRWSFNYSNTNNVTAKIINSLELMIVKGDIRGEYEPYIEQNITFNTPNGLPAIKVTDPTLATYTDENGVMWCADEIDGGRKVYVQRIGKKIFDGTENWKVNSSFTNTVYIEGVGQKKNSVLLSNQYMNDNAFGVVDVACSAGMAINFKDSINAVDVDTWKAHLVEMYAAGNPLVVYFELAEPIETPLTEEEIAELAKAKTYNEVTHINLTGDVKPAIKSSYGVTDVAAFSLENSNELLRVNTGSITALTNRTKVLEDKVGDGFEEITSEEIRALFV